MTGEGNISDKDEKKKKILSFCCRSANFYRYIILLLSTGIFILGQYKFAGSITFSPSLISFEKTFTKHRRDLHDDLLKTVPKEIPKLTFPEEYHVTGLLKLPYGDIVEPFEAWYSGKEKMSRIDYYGGMDRTYQREDIGDYGFAAKVVPEYSEEKNKTFRGCLHHVGTKRFPIRAQSIVPSPKLFKFKGNCELNDSIPCWKWTHKFTILTKVNTYTLYTTRSQPISPIRYEMMGYDTLLTSYYDKYILQYRAFEPWKYDFSAMEIPTELHCFDLSNNEASEATVSSFNPMLEFISHQNAHTNQLNETERSTISSEDDEIPDHFEYDSEKGKHIGSHHFELIVETVFRDFKNVFNKNYKDDVEHVKRKDIFRHNLRYINTFNRQHQPYKLKVNHFADVTDKEMQKYKGLLNESYYDNSAKKFTPPKIDVEVTPIPKTLDWREYGAVAKVRSQGICGSCYAYAVAGAIEGAYYLKTGDMVDLSVQQMVDCSWGFGNKGCKGGYPYRAMQWIIKHGGIATRKSYGQYLAQEGYCHFNNITKGASLEGYFNITSGNSTELKIALALYGPVTVLINTRPRSFKFYDDGIYFDAKCDNRLDHAALAIGYGEENGKEYWLIKNSWSSSWGSEGFIKISTQEDNCGVTQKAVVVEVKKKS